MWNDAIRVVFVSNVHWLQLQDHNERRAGHIFPSLRVQTPDRRSSYSSATLPSFMMTVAILVLLLQLLALRPFNHCCKASQCFL